jgi:hypothetical protein
MSTTGSSDTTAPPAGTKLVWKEQSNSHPRAFANLLGAQHNESVNSGENDSKITLLIPLLFYRLPNGGSTFLLGSFSCVI